MSHQRVAVLLAASIPLTFLIGSVAPIGELGLLVALGGFIWAARTTAGFAGTAFRGAVAGAVAGMLVMGVGFRLAMRVVAISDPTRTPEFTVEGTAFIVVGLGLIVGSFAGGYLGGLRHLLGLERIAMAIIATVLMTPILFGDSEIFEELVDLGFGAWVNIPMFASIVFAYGWAQDGVARRLDRWAAGRRSRSDVVEPAPVP